jgi:TetR/AcrR family transcriptional regulator, transcriptional repressor for nem operon
MSKASRTRQYIIDKSAPVFNTQGYAGTSLKDLTKATGLTKGALYGNFRDKEEIAGAVFQYSMDKVREAARTKMGKAEKYKDKLLSLLDFYAQYVFNSPIPGGCPIMNNAVEADDYHSFIRKAVVTEMKKTTTFISELLEQGIKRGEFRPDIKPRDLALLFFCSIEGAIVVSRVSSSDTAMKLVVSHCRNMVEQICI